MSYDYTYGTGGLLTEIYDGMDNHYSVTYTSGKVTKVAYPDGENFAFVYGNGKTTIRKYTPILQTIHKEIVTYDTATGRLLTFQDAKENVTTYTYVSDSPYLVESETVVQSYQEIGADL